jgi:hypothetical protein
MGLNSRIKERRGQCCICVEAGDDSEKRIITNKCVNHYMKFRRIHLAEREKNKEVRKTKPKPQVVEEVKINISALAEWYQEKMEVAMQKPFCMECGEPIRAGDFHASIAHIFPKSIFDSIRTHPLNYLILGCRCGCHDKTNRLDLFSKMKVWPEAVDRFVSFKDQITEKHKYLNTFLEYALLC